MFKVNGAEVCMYVRTITMYFAVMMLYPAWWSFCDICCSLLSVTSYDSTCSQVVQTVHVRSNMALIQVVHSKMPLVQMVCIPVHSKLELVHTKVHWHDGVFISLKSLAATNYCILYVAIKCSTVSAITSECLPLSIWQVM
jgi:hypothetical protein